MNKWSYKFQRKKQELRLCWSVIIYLFDSAARCAYSLPVSAAPAIPFLPYTFSSSFFCCFRIWYFFSSFCNLFSQFSTQLLVHALSPLQESLVLSVCILLMDHLFFHYICDRRLSERKKDR